LSDIIIQDDEHFERAPVRFKKKCEKAGIGILSDHSHHSQHSHMSQLLARLQADLNSARKAQDKGRVTLLGTIISDVKNREIELKRAITDEDVTDMLRRGIKRRRESIEMYDKGGRADLATIERSEVDALTAYLPVGVSDDEIRAAVVAAIDAGATNVGAVMGKVMSQFKGRAEGGTINAIVREELAARTSRPS
jgi:uncharacterized protein YqeY